MLEKRKIYLCKHCGNVVEGLWNGDPAVKCCGDPMEVLVGNTTDAATEKHVPVVTKDGNKLSVKIGEIAHPMEATHYILFIEVLDGDKVLRHDLKESDTVAEAEFLVAEENLIIRAYCNLHGLWQIEI